MPRYEFQEGTSSKFWEIELHGSELITKFGKIGSNGQTKLKELANANAAKAEYDKLVAEKTKKGYTLAGGKAAKPSKTKSNGKGGAQYFEHSTKFWEITVDGASHTVRFGKLGTDGQSKTKTFKTPAEAYEDYAELVREKMGKGYEVKRGKPQGPPPGYGEAPPEATATEAHDAECEKAIRLHPDDPEMYLVYADYLQSKNDPRGELIVLQHGNKKAAAQKLLDKYPTHFYGKLAEARDLIESDEFATFGVTTKWRWGYLESLWIKNNHDRNSDYGGDKEAIDIEDALGWMLDHPSCRFLRELAVGIVEFSGNDYSGIAKVIGKRQLPTLKKLVLGEFHSEETELNWSDLGNLEPMYKALPNLETLVLRSGSMKIGKIDLPKLRELRIVTGGMDTKSLASITNAKWPSLETLSIQLGNEHDLKLKHVQPILDGKAFPKVKHLGLGNSDITDDICKGLAASKIAAQLESLDLSQGTMGDDGATALAQGKFPKLQTLDIGENWISKKGLAGLKNVAKKLVGTGGGRSGQQDDGGDRDNRYIAAYE